MINPCPKGRWSRTLSLSLGACLCLALAGVLSCSGPVRDPQANWSDAKKDRVQAAARQRRIIFNDDTYELSREDADTPEGFLKRRLQPLAGTQVDTISWSILGGWADAPVYDSKIQPIYGDAHGGPPLYWSKVTSNVKRLIQAGRGPLQIAIDFARSQEMEILASVRMNDVHDSFIEGGLTTWKKEHSEFLVDPSGMLTALELYVTAQDFSHPEVRQRKFEIIEEVARRYEVDGFELDFIRHPVFFSQTLQGKPVSAAQVEVMTAFMRRIRRLTDSQAERRGRPLLLATRVPDSFQLALNIGLDLKRWLKEDLVDILIAGGGYAPFSLPLGEFTAQAHPHGVLVYPCINQGAANSVSRGSFLEAVRAMASNWFQTGADGIYLWNLGHAFRVQDREGSDRDAPAVLCLPERYRRAPHSGGQEQAVLRGHPRRWSVRLLCPRLQPSAATRKPGRSHKIRSRGKGAAGGRRRPGVGQNKRIAASHAAGPGCAGRGPAGGCGLPGERQGPGRWTIDGHRRRQG